MPGEKIAIIGQGNVGSALKQAAESAQYEVRTTGADPKEVEEAARWAGIIILAIPAQARQDAIKHLGGVRGKILIDPTNLLNADWSYAGDIRKSGAEQVQEWAQGARVVKAFNTVFAQNMSTGKVAGQALSLFVASDDTDAKRQVMALGEAIGFEPVDTGDLSTARYLEALGFLNIQLGYGPLKYGTRIGFKLVGMPRRSA